jgi:predicted ATPase
MSKIKIKNFGPIKKGYPENNGWIDIKKVTMFIGNQGSGKSTVAKLISTFTWIEKAITRGDYDIKHFERKNKLKNQYLKYHRLENYFSHTNEQDDTCIEYQGEAYHIVYEDGNLKIQDAKNGHYHLPQIMYVPAERNFIANVKKPKALSLTSDSLIEFVTEFNNALNAIKGSIGLPIGNIVVEYNKLNDLIYLKGKVNDKPYRIKLTEASSGFQSLVPLYLVSWFLSKSVESESHEDKELMTSELRERFRKRAQAIHDNNDLTEEQKRIALSEEAKKFNKTALINIIEEPEQNLYPDSQRYMLHSLLKFNNLNADNKLIMTTHSPYLINYLTHAVKAGSILQKIEKAKAATINEVTSKLYEVIPAHSTVAPDEWVVYELNEDDGSIIRLENYKGLPSDENYLNKSLGESNDIFIRLMEIDDLCR